MPDRVFANYDDYYYYEDEVEPEKEPEQNRVRRSPRSKRCSSKTHCCRCLEKNKDLTKEEYRKYYNFFLTDNPNTECPKAGHAAYSDAVRTEVSRKVYLNNNTYEPNFPDLSVSASNFMVIVLLQAQISQILNYSLIHIRQLQILFN